jgi:hypothetical protein
MIIIEVKGGVVTNVISDDPIGYILVDWDNIEQGDEFSSMEDFRQADLIVDNIEEALTSLRINNILKDGNNV